VFQASIHHVHLCAPFEFWSCVRRSALVQIPFVQFAKSQFPPFDRSTSYLCGEATLVNKALQARYQDTT
jgi:hypothetical protein